MTTDADTVIETITLLSRFQEPIEEIMHAVLEDGHDPNEIAIVVMTEKCSIVDKFLELVPAPFSRYVRTPEGCAVFMCMRPNAISGSLSLSNDKEKVARSFSMVSRGSAAVVFLAEKVTIVEYGVSDESTNTRSMNQKTN